MFFMVMMAVMVAVMVRFMTCNITMAAAVAVVVKCGGVAGRVMVVGQVVMIMTVVVVVVWLVWFMTAAAAAAAVVGGRVWGGVGIGGGRYGGGLGRGEVGRAWHYSHPPLTHAGPHRNFTRPMPAPAVGCSGQLTARPSLGARARSKYLANGIWSREY